jgi:hypothetical protein
MKKTCVRYVFDVRYRHRASVFKHHEPLSSRHIKKQVGSEVCLFVLRSHSSPDVLAVKPDGSYRHAEHLGDFVVCFPFPYKIGNENFFRGEIKIPGRALVGERRNDLVEIGFHD